MNQISAISIGFADGNRVILSAQQGAPDVLKAIMVHVSHRARSMNVAIDPPTGQLSLDHCAQLTHQVTAFICQQDDIEDIYAWARWLEAFASGIHQGQVSDLAPFVDYLTQTAAKVQAQQEARDPLIDISDLSKPQKRMIDGMLKESRIAWTNEDGERSAQKLRAARRLIGRFRMPTVAGILPISRGHRRSRTS